MSKKSVDIIVIPSISDPRSTLTSIAMFQNAFNIDPPIPVVVIYGTCPEPLRALGEGGRRIRNWRPHWDDTRDVECRDRFSDVSQFNGIPVYFFDRPTQFTVWESLRDSARRKSITLPDGLTEDTFVKAVDAIFGATYSYGAQRNKAFIVANNLGARFVFFFDDDTYVAPHVGNMIERHSQLLKRKNVFAVTGGYFGQRAFNTTIFRRIGEQQEVMGLLGYEIPDDQATQDLWGWRMADGVLGGNFCTRKPVYQRICCPSMHRTPTTDDKLIGREIRRVFGRQSHVYKTGWPVIHIHFPDRMHAKQVEPYLRSWAKTKAFWVLYDAVDSSIASSVVRAQSSTRGKQEATKTVVDFGRALLKLAEKEEKMARGALAKAVRHAARTIIDKSDTIVTTVWKEMQEFKALKSCWQSVLDVTSKMRLWKKGENYF